MGMGDGLVMSNNLDFIESYLLDNGCDIEDYTNPEKGVCQLEAILDELNNLIEYKYIYIYMDLCK